MISIDDAVIARYTRSDLTFEILVDPEKSWDLKHGTAIKLEDVLAVTDVFEDSAKGKRASDSDMNKVFGTTKFNEVAMKIIKEGEIQLTTDQKRKMQENKRRQVIQFIAQNAVDPRTHLPHPVQRIENAMEEAGVHIDPFKRVHEQVDEVMKKLKLLLPLKIETDRIAVKIPPQHAYRAYPALKQFRVIKEDWLDDGSLSIVVELPGGMQADFFDKINKATHGEIDSKVLERF